MGRSPSRWDATGSSASRTRACASRPAFTSVRAGRCTCRRGLEPRLSHSGTSPGPRRRNWCYNPCGDDDLERHPRKLCRRRRVRGRRSARAGGERDSQAQGCAHLRRGRASARRAASRRRVGVLRSRCRTGSAAACHCVPRPHGEGQPRGSRCDHRRDRAAVTGPRVAGLTGVTLQDAPTVCHECVWWQTREGRTTDKRKWIEKAETEWGPWGTVYYDADGHVLGSMQYGPAGLFPRAAELPAGPPSDDAVLVTCAYLTDSSKPWVMQSLFLTAIGEARDRGARALEAFAYRYAEGAPVNERFLHKTIFPR